MTSLTLSIPILVSASLVLWPVSLTVAETSGWPGETAHFAVGATPPPVEEGLPASHILVTGDASRANSRASGRVEVAQSSEDSLRMADAIERAIALIEEGERDRAKDVLSDLVYRQPTQGKIESYSRQLDRIDAPPGSADLRKQLEAEGGPSLADEEAQAIHLFAVLSQQDGPAVRCGNAGTDALLQLAALNAHAPSQFMMGVLLAGGTECGWTPDLETAAYWYSEAAGQGHDEAEVNYAIALLLGSGVPKDMTAAIERLTVSAGENDNARAQYLLGTLYLAGHGVRKITTKAIRFLRASAEQGFIPAQTSLGEILWERAILEEEREEARMWLRKAAEQGDANAQYALGKAYSCGVAGECGFDEARRWLEYAAKAGHPKAQQTLGLLLWDGDTHNDTVPPQRMEAVRWLRAAAEQGRSWAQTYLGYAYANGVGGVEVDLPTALAWWRRAAEQNNPRAEEELGYAYLEGRGVPRNGQAAREWFERAAQHGSMGAKEVLAQTDSELQRLSQRQTIVGLAAVLIGAAALSGEGGGGNAGAGGCNQAFCGTPEYNGMMMQFATGGM